MTVRILIDAPACELGGACQEVTRAAAKDFSMDAEAAALQLLLRVKVLEAFLCPKDLFTFLTFFLSAIFYQLFPK